MNNVNSMDMDMDHDMPGGDDFEDITGLFYRAARDMASDEVIMTDGFTLMDAMSAFEIGEPRMDSGMAITEDGAPAFDSMAPLLPEELCWIMDRMFACEMQWHSGNTLSQTVFTLLYVHELQDLNPDMLPPGWPPHPDPNRPLELLTVVLRASVFGLLKCCDLAWRELSQRRVYDIEDWQSEKSEVSLLESVPVNLVLERLDDACHWLRASNLPSEQQEALLDRILLRKHLVELFNLSVSENLDLVLPLVTSAFETLLRVQSRPSVTPGNESPATLVFDPRVSRRLHTVIPIRVVELPEQPAVWSAVEQLLHGWADVDYLRDSSTISTWQVFGSHTVAMPGKELQFAYIRSLTQGAFYNRQVVLEQYPPDWLVEHFFLETLGISYELICDILITSWAGGDALQFEDVEYHIIKITSENVKSFWFNPPRRRRYLMKSIVDLRALQDTFILLYSQVVVSSPRSVNIMKALPEAANVWTLTAAREIILGGFEQDLYAPYERPLAYWLVAHIADQHIRSLETLNSLSLAGTVMQKEWNYQIAFLSSIQMMSIALCSMTASAAPPREPRASLNFRRRYKWLFASNHGGQSEMLLQLPPQSQYIQDLAAFSQQDNCTKDYFMLANATLSRLLTMDAQTLCGEEEATMRYEFARSLWDVNKKLLKSATAGHTSESLRWDTAYHQWFPDVILDEA